MNFFPLRFTFSSQKWSLGEILQAMDGLVDWTFTMKTQSVSTNQLGNKRCLL
jgi:hypothetical protein